ncbi:MAG: glycerate kinase [Alphaproteobacteria bacterium]|nr:glycerate kinase [Alphaproteobacteria bacterium]
MPDQIALMKAMFTAAVKQALPEHGVAANMPSQPKGRTIVIGAGKASAAMARVFEQKWKGPLEGLVVTRYGHVVPCERIEIVEAAHPVPDAAGTRAAERILQMVQGLSEDDLVVALISGGGSALLSLAVDGVTAEEKRAVNKALLASGAPIAEMNCVRKHLSRIKGGRLAAAAFPAQVHTLVISDVPGDDLAAVASGPTVADASTFAEARAIIAKYGIEVPPSVTAHLAAAKNETPKTLANTKSICIASPQQSLEAAATVAKQAGYIPIILGDAIEGEAREVGIVMAGIAMQARRFNQPVKPPCAMISGGETTVTVKGKGAGGRNVEYLLSLALKLAGAENIFGLAGDTDGIDGARDVAGAFITPDTLQKARDMGLDPWQFLANNDAHNFFEKLGTQIITGPTLTNVNDFRVVLVG